MKDPNRQPGESPLETLLLDSAGRPQRTRRWLPRTLLGLLVLTLLFGGYWSREPALPDVRDVLAEGTPAPGVASTGMLVATLRALLDKPGGLLANDLLPPGALLDDLPAFENGALQEMRTFLRALRRDFSRPVTQAVEDPDLLRAEPHLLFDSGNWRAPSAESEYADALVDIGRYLVRLQADPPSAAFYPRADSLAGWLDEVIAQLDEQARQLAAAPRTRWLDVDDRFFAARGYCWALRGQLAALRHDFSAPPAGVGVSAVDAHFAAALAALDGTRQPVTSPVILNGGEYGVLANHSLVLAGHVGRVAVALRALRGELATYRAGEHD